MFHVSQILFSFYPKDQTINNPNIQKTTQISSTGKINEKNETKKSRTNRKIQDTKMEFTRTPETQSQLLRKTIQKNQPTTYGNDFQRKEKKRKEKVPRIGVP
jgi:hypothetical protein